MNKRNSSIELLKIIAMFLIAFSHAVPMYGKPNLISYINLDMVTKNLEVLLCIIIRYLGNIGNIIFLMCSFYFLVDSKNSKKDKILNMILDSLVISIIWLIVSLIFRKGIPIFEIIKQFFPITFENNWFVGCYILLYLIHPILNKAINSLNQKQLLRMNVVTFILYFGIQFIFSGKYYYNNLIGFICIYFFIAYVKKYMNKFSKNKRLNILILYFSCLMNLLIIILTNYVGLKNIIFANMASKWNVVSNPFSIMIGLALFNIFNTKNYFNKNINYISSLSLVFYLIHENIMFKNYIKPLFYQHVFKSGHILIWVCVEAIGLFCGGILLAILYKETIQKIVYKISPKLYKFFKEKYIILEKKLLKID